MKILVVDDHVLIREALRGVLKELVVDATIIEAPNSRLAMQQIAENPELALILLDLNLPDRDGFDLLAELRERYPAVSIVIMSGNEERENIKKSLDLGALGFIPKSARREVMLSAFNLVFAGGIYVPPELLLQRDPPPQSVAPMQIGKRISGGDLGLTERQMEVLALMMQGKSNKAICRMLDVAEPTVKNHVTAILRVLKASNRTEAVIAAAALGVSPPRNAK
jgi:DNA-binding NarL/FixJ family response regulator